MIDYALRRRFSFYEMELRSIRRASKESSLNTTPRSFRNWSVRCEA